MCLLVDLVTEMSRLIVKTAMPEPFNASHMVAQDLLMQGYMPVSDIVVLAR